MTRKFSKKDMQVIANGRNIEKFERIIKNKRQMIEMLKSEIEEIESLIKWNKSIDEMEE